MSKKVLGLDIRKDAITAVLLKSGIRESEIEACIRVPVVNGNDNTELSSGLTKALKKVRESMDIEGSVCIASLPADDLSYRSIDMPFKGKKKIAQVLPFELEPVLPFPVDDLIFDFFPLPFHGNDNQTGIFTAIVPKKYMQSYLNGLNETGFDPLKISVSSYSLALAAAKGENLPESGILMDIGKNVMAIFLFTQKKVCLIRTYPFDPAGKNRAEKIACFTDQTLMAFEDFHEKNIALDHIMLTGPGLFHFSGDDDKKIEALLNIPVSRMNLNEDGKIHMTGAVKSVWKPDEMDSALALALDETEGISRLNLRKGPFAPRKKWMEYKNIFIRTGIFTLIVLILIFANIMIESGATQKKLKKVEKEIEKIFRSALPDVKRIVDPVHQLRTAINEIKKETVSPLDAPHIRVIDILNELSQKIPKNADIIFSRLVVNTDNILISGNAKSFNTVDDVQGKIESSPMFKKVTIVSTEIDKKKNRVRFKMKVDI